MLAMQAIFLRLDAHLAMEQIVGQRLLDMTNVSQHYALYTGACCAALRLFAF